MADLIIFVILMLLGFFVGRHLEQKHYRSIREREAALVKLPASDIRRPLFPEKVAKTRFVSGNVVISVDFFKRFMAGLYNLVGGNVSSYETLVDRARREAILRMKESAQGADEIINLRVETSAVSQNANRGTVGSIEVLAYGTAIKYG
jgi:uncharacterized protein YbjQ (UPF0145 family)